VVAMCDRQGPPYQGGGAVKPSTAVLAIALVATAGCATVLGTKNTDLRAHRGREPRGQRSPVGLASFDATIPL
jgi:hypothetical protein